MIDYTYEVHAADLDELLRLAGEKARSLFGQDVPLTEQFDIAITDRMTSKERGVVLYEARVCVRGEFSVPQIAIWGSSF